MRWEIRYSSSEMLYLDVTDHEVRSYLNDDTDSADRWSFEEVLAGAADSRVRHDFGEETLVQLKVTVRAKRDATRPPAGE